MLLTLPGGSGRVRKELSFHPCSLDRIAMLTLRKRIAEALEAESLDVREISQRFHLREKEVLDHLQHIARSAGGKRFIVEPASCSQCGFSFRKRQRLSTPSRCPVCRNEQILSPRFQILPHCCPR